MHWIHSGVLRIKEWFQARVWSNREDDARHVWHKQPLSVFLLFVSAVILGYWGVHYPFIRPGVAVTTLAVAAAVMTVMGEMKGLEKVAWILVLFGFLGLELRSIRVEQKAQDELQAATHSEQVRHFREIGTDIKSSIEVNEAHFNTTMAGLDEGLKVATGGDTICYVEPERIKFTKAADAENSQIMVLLKKKGKYPLYNVGVQILGTVDPLPVPGVPSRPDDLMLVGPPAPIALGELPAGDQKSWYGSIHTEYKYRPSGTEIHLAFRARNGIWHQTLLLRRWDDPKTGLIHWLSATRVYRVQFGEKSEIKRVLLLEKIDKDFPSAGNIEWREKLFGE